MEIKSAAEVRNTRVRYVRLAPHISGWMRDSKCHTLFSAYNSQIIFDRLNTTIYVFSQDSRPVYPNINHAKGKVATVLF
jgi:hypothetical protein